jgi:hypothetical protein
MIKPLQHRRFLRTTLGACVALSASLLAASTISCADAAEVKRGEVEIIVRVEAKPEPKKAIGLIFSASKSQQISETSITKIGDKLYEIRFVAPRAALQNDSVASAIAYDETGAVSFANITPALAPETREILASIPECPGEDGSRLGSVASPGTLQQLIDVRTERMNIVRVKINRLLDESFLAKLQKFEEAFGLSYPSSLSADLPPEELIERLSRVNQAVKKYQMYKPKAS